MSTVPAPPDPTQPVETPFADAASPFKRTNAEMPAYVPVAPPSARAADAPAHSAWDSYRSQINFGFAVLAYLMIVVGAATLIEANPSASWKYYIAALPAVPALIALVIFVRALMRLDELQARVQLYAFGLALGATALATFTYGFFEGVGLPDLPPSTVLPVAGVFWGVGTALFTWRYRRR